MLARLLIALSAALAAVVPVREARARSEASVELSAGAGYDNALFRLAPEVPSDVSTQDYFVETRPRLELDYWSSPDQRLTLGYEGSVRELLDPGNGLLYGHALLGAHELRITSDWWTQLALWGALERSTRVESSNYRAAGGHAGIAWQPARRARLGVAGAWRALDSGADTDLLAGATADASVRLAALELGGRVQWLGSPRAHSQLSATIAAGLPIGRVHLGADAMAGRVAFTDSTGTWLGYGGEADVALSAAWRVALRYSGTWERYATSDLPLLSHSTLVTVRYTWSSTPATLRDVLARARASAPASGEARVSAPEARTRVAITVRGCSAAASRLVGDFDGWSQEGIELKPNGPDTCHAILELAPGRYLFQLRLDGALVTPVGAPAYAQDDFGGRDAVLNVDQEPEEIVVDAP